MNNDKSMSFQTKMTQLLKQITGRGVTTAFK